MMDVAAPRVVEVPVFLTNFAVELFPEVVSGNENPLASILFII
jgi:hypothetical protein